MGWCLDSREALGSVLIMWDMRVGEKINECVGVGSWRSLLELSKIISLGLLRVFMALIPIGIEGSFGMSWLVYSVGGICLSALGAILTLLDSLVRDRAKLVYAQLW
jgi:hypothetical protein